MDDTDPDKLEAAPDRLVIERERRIQASIEAGEVIEIQTVVVVHPDEERAVARHAPDDDVEAETPAMGVSRADRPRTHISTSRLLWI